MSDLDNKLGAILGNQINKGAANTLADWSIDHNRTIARIKQAFTEFGYVPLDLVRIAKDPQVIESLHNAGFQITDIFDKPMMTGQEWFDRFIKEHEKLGTYPIPNPLGLVKEDTVLLAAKRSAGIE